MLSNLVFSQQFLCFPTASDTQYEVTRARQPCWVFGTEARPIACILLMSKDGSVQQTQPRLHEELAFMTLSRMSETARIVIVNLLFARPIEYEARLANGLSMSDTVKPGGALATKVFLDNVRAFEIVIRSEKITSNDKWTFCADGIICRPRTLLEEEQERERESRKAYTIIGGGGPIRSVFYDDMDVDKDEEGSVENQTSRPLDVRIQINSAIVEHEMLSDANSIMASALSLANCMTANERLKE